HDGRNQEVSQGRDATTVNTPTGEKGETSRTARTDPRRGRDVGGHREPYPAMRDSRYGRGQFQDAYASRTVDDGNGSFVVEGSTTGASGRSTAAQTPNGGMIDMATWKERVAAAQERGEFTDEDVKDARSYRHCAVGEAMNVGQEDSDGD